MNEWKTYKLSEIGSIVGGATPSTSVARYYGGDIPWLTPKDLSTFQGRFIGHGERNITQAGLDSCSAQLLPAGTVLFSSRAPIGYVAIAQNPITTNQGFKSVIPNEDVDSLFLYYSLKYNKEKIESMGSGTTFKEVSGSTMKNVEISLPSLKEQKRIAKLLGSIDDKIEINYRINDNLEQQAQALYKQWFVDFEFPNEEGNPYKSSGGQMKKTELGEIPEKWHVGALKDIANVIMGQSPNGKSFNENGEGIVFYQGRTEFGSRYPSIRLYTTEPTRFAEPMSILLSVRAPVGDINIATQRCCIGRGVASIDSKTGDNSYMYCCLKELRPQLDQYNGEGTVFGSINRKELEGLPLCIPNAKVIHEFNNLITGIEKQMFNLYQECSNLTTLRDTLLPRLMSGELSVDDVSTDLVC